MNGPPVIVIGAGGHGKVLVDTLRLLGRTIQCVVDANPQRTGQTLLDAPIAGSESLLEPISPADVELVNGVGSAKDMSIRRRVFETWVGKGFRFATIVHPTAFVSTNARLGHGAQILAGAIVQCGSLVGDNCLINTRASVDHDCEIGASCHVAPGVTICGGTRVGAGTHVGTGACVIQGIRIGAGALVGAGAVVIRDVADGETVLGVPARRRG